MSKSKKQIWIPALVLAIILISAVLIFILNFYKRYNIIIKTSYRPMMSDTYYISSDIFGNVKVSYEEIGAIQCIKAPCPQPTKTETINFSDENMKKIYETLDELSGQHGNFFKSIPYSFSPLSTSLNSLDKDQAALIDSIIYNDESRIDN